MNSILLIKALHIIALVCWFAGLFYFPRLLVYHQQNKKNEQLSKVFSVMEKKLLFYIMHPSALATIIFGLWLVVLAPQYAQGMWFHFKMLLVLLLIVFQYYCNIYRKQLVQDNCQKSSKFFRIFNEIPTVILIVIVFLVIFKP